MSIRLKIRSHLSRWIAGLVLVLFCLYPTLAQPAEIPESHELLNGLKILLWPKPGSPNVVIKLRIHSGSAFDLSGKAGEMALFGDILFPDPATNDYFTEQIDGKLNVAVTYDSITITMIGKADQIDNILDVLRNAIMATQLTPEVVNRTRDARMKLVKDSAVAPSIVADRAISLRLFGDFPYGRPIGGSPEELARVDRPDLMLARDRFLNSNNATLAIVGTIDKAHVLKVLRQHFGAWRKSEDIVPSTFQAAKPPDSRVLIVNLPSPNTEIRLACRGVARSDRDYYAALVLAKVVQVRWQASTPDLASKRVFARSESFVLPGIFSMGTETDTASASAVIASAHKAIESASSSPPTPTELRQAKQDALAESDSRGSRDEAMLDAWLDLDTYKLKTMLDRTNAIQAVSSGDVQRVAARILKDKPVATVIVGDAANLRTALQGHLQFEVLGEITETAPAPKPPVKPGVASQPR